MAAEKFFFGGNQKINWGFYVSNANIPSNLARTTKICIKHPYITINQLDCALMPVLRNTCIQTKHGGQGACLLKLKHFSKFSSSKGVISNPLLHVAS